MGNKKMFKQALTNYTNLGTDFRNELDSNHKQNIDSINSQYNSSKSTLDSNYQTQRKQAQTDYDYSKQAVEKTQQQALKDAYIKNMQNQKNFRQNMSAQGLNGGASMSALTSMNNSYQTARNEANDKANDSYEALGNQYQKGLSDLSMNYNTNLTNLENQKLQQEQSARNNYVNYLSQHALNDRNNYLNFMMTVGKDMAKIPTVTVNSPTASADQNTQKFNSGTGTNAAKSTQNMANTAAASLAAQLASTGDANGVREAAYEMARNGKLTGIQLMNIFNALGIQA